MKISRDILQALQAWKQSATRQPLILQGARQIGKSWVVEEFGRQQYRHTAVFNFDRNLELRKTFANTKDVTRLLSELALYTPVPIVEGETLLFFDEIQDCPEALAALKYFNEDAPGHHIIAAGSLLGVATRHGRHGADLTTFPVGKVSFLDMHPVTFKEFLRMANTELFKQIETYLPSLEPLPEVLFNQASEQFRRFQVCGGMPRPCSDMLDGAGLETIESDLAELLRAYEYDFTKHVNAAEIPRIHEIWRSIPSQLARENKKFIFRIIREGARAREYESALNWLVLAGMVHRVYCVEQPLIPLKHYENTTAFKVYVLDQAILRQLSDLPIEAVTARNDVLREFSGAMAENYVLTSLLAQGFKTPHYWTLQGNKAEVDFLLQSSLEVIPVEVKAGTNIKGRSLIEYQKRYEPRLRLRLSMQNIKRDGNLVNLPIFLCDWIREVVKGLESRG